MVGLTAFAYRAGSSRLHRMDVRCKILCLILLGTASLHAGAGSLFVFAFAGVLQLYSLGTSWWGLLKQLRFFFCFLAFLTIVRMFSEPGDTFFRFMWFEATREGLRSGALVSLRLLALVVWGLLFIVTSRSAAVKTGTAWLFRPIPFIPENKIATMLGLLIRFIPMIFETIETVSLAQKARCIEYRKNPVTRIKRSILPVFRQIFQSADRLVTAMEARCYTDRPTPYPLRFTRTDLIAVVFAVSLCAVLILF